MEDESVVVLADVDNDDDDDDANKAMVGFGGIGSWRAALNDQARRWANANARVVDVVAKVGVVTAVTAVVRNNRNDAKPLLADVVVVVVVATGKARQLQAEAAAVTINVTSSKPIVQQQLRQRWRPIVVRIFDIFRKRFL
jgi:hypothetical protein